MRNDLPLSIRNSIHDLEPEAMLRLFMIKLTDGTIFRLSPYGEITWQGHVYDAIPCHMTEVNQDADGKVTRPKFSFANPEGLFSAEIYQGKLDNAQLTRYRLLKRDLDLDNDFKVTEMFRITRIVNLSQSIAVAEMRDVMDGQNFKLPARAFFPPEFPHVKLS